MDDFDHKNRGEGEYLAFEDKDVEETKNKFKFPDEAQPIIRDHWRTRREARLRNYLIGGALAAGAGSGVAGGVGLYELLSKEKTLEPTIIPIEKPRDVTLAPKPVMKSRFKLTPEIIAVFFAVCTLIIITQK